ncbi:hypothetical protein NUU61_002986 [Penicillium alfredii]|uniref:F-box domain-containing protein n=1 Tax=Penicillium alfredii TaxID=1506179 RepID=A0A9W9FSK6_9EURO|nr:uncharacterized protein NUU61_002986 [Penicillium alfredii]KAJ5105639.1 hypothetical protein NUU61_002986 [Penicillium alfredii]
MDTQEPKARLDQLPPELIHIILEAIPDIQSLELAVLSGPSLYSVFKRSQTRITKRVLLRQVPKSLLHEAVAVKAAREAFEPLDEFDEFEEIAEVPELFDSFSEDYRDRTESGKFRRSVRFKLSHARKLAAVQPHVEFFTKRLVSDVLARNPITGESASSPRPLSGRERNRIQCALYRFEIYCSLLQGSTEVASLPENGSFEYFGFLEEREIAQLACICRFAEEYPAQEIEQLACIYEFLLRIITPGKKSLSLVLHIHSLLRYWHDPHPELSDLIAFPETRTNEFEYDEEDIDLDPPEKSVFYTPQHHMCLGLAHIRRFAEAETPQACLDIIAATNEREGLPEFSSYYLSPARPWGDYLVKDVDPETRKSRMKPWYPDRNPGPRDVWLWGRWSLPFDEPLFSPRTEPLRRWAYVMWDKSRLDEWKVFEQEWQPSLE